MTCCYCERKIPRGQRSIEHIVPLSKNGKNCPANRRECCKSCNNERSNKDYGVWIAEMQARIKEECIDADLAMLYNKIIKNCLLFQEYIIKNRTDITYDPRYCCYCERLIRPGQYTREHLVPVSKGGSNSLKNLRDCCRRCNNDRQAKEYPQWIQELQDRIKSPTIKPVRLIIYQKIIKNCQFFSQYVWDNREDLYKYGKELFCFYCQQEIQWGQLVKDHLLIPKKGGNDSIANTRECCRGCQEERNNRNYEQWISEMRMKYNEPGTTAAQRDRLAIKISNCRKLIKYLSTYKELLRGGIRQTSK